MLTKEYMWLLIGFLGQALFSGRFLVQWLISEKKRRSVIPTSFWYLSLSGGIVLLAYAIHKQDPVFILGQFMGLFIYLRNLYLIQLSKNANEETPSEKSSHFTDQMRDRSLIVGMVGGLIGMIGLAILFYFFPEWDIATAKLFYNTGFPRGIPWIEFLRTSVNITSYAVVGGIIIGWIGHFTKKWPLWKFNNRIAIFLAVSLALGPALLVNGICKNGFHRARPHQITEFGGEKTFTPAFVITDQCAKNCSFVSGDPSIMFYLFAFVLLFPKWRIRGFFITLAMGSLIGYGRLYYGAHFLSDIIFSAFMTYLTVLSVYILFGQPRYREISLKNA